MAAETIWKAAWIYEEIAESEKAIQLYQEINRHWFRSAYRFEAKFRLGLSFYRLNQYSEAAAVFSEIAQGRWSKTHLERAKYWLAKTYQKVDRNDDAFKLYTELANNIFDSYYSTRSFMLYKQHFDSLFQVGQRLSNSENPLREFSESFATLVNDFKKLFLIRELLGDDLALLELSGRKFRAKSLKELVSIAEIYKRLGAYNQAYRTYDQINNLYFGDQIYLDKPYILKEMYPLYYDNLINRYSDLRNIDKNLVLAVIRAESGYDRRAHSWADAYGLMQIIPPTARALALELNVICTIPENLFDPELNINMGTFYLQKLLKQFQQKPELALAAYNAGPHRVEEWKKIKDNDEIDIFIENIEFSQTRIYVRRVMRNYWVYSILDEVN